MKIKTLLFFLVTIISWSQNPGTLTGKIIDKNSKIPIPYVNVSVFDGDKLITGGITDDNGVFNVKNIPLKQLKVEIMFIGYKKLTRNITFSTSNNSINLGTLEIEDEAIQLKGVEIVSERSTFVQKIDRKVINIGKDIIASGNTASDILNNVPTVSIDPQTREISLRGNTNVRVLIDGKPSNIDAAQLLQQIPSSSIKQIELITNPSAKYNPEGMSGLINIILHKNTNDGFNGSINTGVTFGITPKTNDALNLNYKIGKVNLYSNYGFNHGKNRNWGEVTSERPNFENYQDFGFTNLNTSHLLKLGIDYYLNDKNTFSFFTNQNISLTKGNSLTSIDYENPNGRDSDQFNTSRNENNTKTYDFVYKHDFDKKGETIDFQTNYSITDNPDFTNFRYVQQNPVTTTNTLNDIHRDIEYLQLNLDYVNPLSETMRLELGAESRIQRIKNNFDENVTEASSNYNRTGNSNFDFRRNIHAVYANLGKEWGKWSAQAGVRIEQYEISGDFERVVTSTNTSENINDKSKVTDEIFTAYPSVFLNYKLNEKESFNFNYSRRVDRPSIGQLSPIREWTTPLIESRGNPALEPQFTNSFEISYTKIAKIGSITGGVFYRRINDEISRVIFKNPENPAQDIISFDNFNDNNAYGVEASANLKLTTWWSINASSDAYFKTVRGTVENGSTGELEQAEVDVIIFNTRLTQNFIASKKLRFNMFTMYRGRDLSLQFERLPMYRFDLGASYTILQGSGTITARVNDMFRWMQFAFDGNIPYRQYGNFNWESRTLYVGFNYNFGGAKNRALQRKQRDARETQSSGGMM